MPAATDRKRLGELAMLGALSRKVDAMRQTAHDHAMRQEGACAALEQAAGQVEEALEKAESGTAGQKAKHLLEHLAQVARVHMLQQAGRALQAADTLEVCRALAAEEASAGGAAGAKQARTRPGATRAA